MDENKPKFLITTATSRYYMVNNGTITRVTATTLSNENWDRLTSILRRVGFEGCIQLMSPILWYKYSKVK